MKCSRCQQENPPQAKFSLFEYDEAALVLVRERAVRRGITLEQSIDPRLGEIQGRRAEGAPETCYPTRSSSRRRVGESGFARSP